MAFEDAPHLRKAIEYLINDQGLSTDADTVDLPYAFEDHSYINWIRVNNFLGTLREADLGTFCIGDQDDMLAIVSKHGPEAEYAYKALDVLFESLGEIADIS